MCYREKLKKNLLKNKLSFIICQLTERFFRQAHTISLEQMKAADDFIAAGCCGGKNLFPFLLLHNIISKPQIMMLPLVFTKQTWVSLKREMILRPDGPFRVISCMCVVGFAVALPKQGENILYY